MNMQRESSGPEGSKTTRISLCYWCLQGSWEDPILDSLADLWGLQPRRPLNSGSEHLCVDLAKAGTGSS